jgi:hypothetical protein
VAQEVLASLQVPANADVLQLDLDSVTVHVPTSEPPQWPFSPGRVARSWTLPRDSRIIASLPVTPAITSAARKAALVTLSEIHGRRATMGRAIDLGKLRIVQVSNVLPGHPVYHFCVSAKP